jgi:urea transporter
MLHDSGYESPNLLGLLAGLATIFILGAMIAGLIWYLGIVFSPWAAL